VTQHPYDDIDAFALGSLTPAEANELLRHADSCPTCAVLITEAMTGVDALAQLDGEKDVRRSLVAPLARRPRRFVVPPSWAVATAAMAASIGLLIWNVNLQQGLPTLPIAAIVHSHFQHHELLGPSGSAKVLQATDGRWVYVVADGLTPRARYVLWEKRGSAPTKVGEFAADGAGRAARYFEQAPGSIDGFSVTSIGEDPTSPQSLNWSQK